MNLHASWAYFVLVAIVMGLAATPLFRFVDTTSTANTRYTAIDGLRGFLALSVFVFHLVLTHEFIQAGLWEVPSSRFYALLGPFGVSLFFMITGFLFWGKLLRVQGRPPWLQIYTGRLFRIAPMYLFVVLVMIYIVFTRTGFQLNEPVSEAVNSVLQWLALGAINTQPNINGYPATSVLAGVTWTITYEWAFYVSLMVTAFFARGRQHLLFVFIALGISLTGKVLLHSDILGLSALFVTGVVIASLMHEKWILPISSTAASGLALVCLAMIFITSSSGYGTLTLIGLGLFLFCVHGGVPVWLTDINARPASGQH